VNGILRASASEALTGKSVNIRAAVKR